MYVFGRQRKKCGGRTPAALLPRKPAFSPRSVRGFRGVSFVDAIVGIALLLIVFLGIFGAFRLSIELVFNAKARAGAVALANDQMEFIRSLPYADVGTVGGIPPGVVAQEETVTLNAIPYNRRTLIQYVDAPEDGLGIDDDTGIIADYKRAKVELSWERNTGTSSVSVVSNIAPRGIESTDGGGTLKLNVFDALAAPVQGAEVQVQNNDTSPAIDVTSFSNTDGIVWFPGAPEAGNYEIAVTKTGYSSAGTHNADAANPNPSPAHLSVAEGLTTTFSFAIDLLAQKTIRTFEPLRDETFFDSFPSAANLAALNNTHIAGGAIILDDVDGEYLPNGDARSVNIAPAFLFAWDSLSFQDSEPANTEARYRLYAPDAGGAPALIPDTDLPGNSAGFTASPVSLSSLDADVYDAIAVEAALATADTASTPSALDWTVSYTVGPMPVPNVAFSMRGDKTTGTDGTGLPIYKYNQSHSTDGTGSITIPGLEWDTYTISIDGSATGYDIAESCMPQPRSIAPDENATTDLFLVPDTSNTLLVSVLDAGATPIENALVRLYRGAYDETIESSACGAAFFQVPAAANDYTLDVGAIGYTPEIIPNVVIEAGEPATVSVTLLPL